MAVARIKIDRPSRHRPLIGHVARRWLMRAQIEVAALAAEGGELGALLPRRAVLKHAPDLVVAQRIKPVLGERAP
jgi:hypothetical protein